VECETCSRPLEAEERDWCDSCLAKMPVYRRPPVDARKRPVAMVDREEYMRIWSSLHTCERWGGVEDGGWLWDFAGDRRISVKAE
jgi:hypothetical protein